MNPTDVPTPAPVTAPIAPVNEDREIDALVAQATEAAMRGENIEQLLEFMLATFPQLSAEKIRKKFLANITKRGLKAPNKESDVPARNAMVRLREIFAASARQAIDRVAALVRSRPDIQATVQQAGKILMKNGVVIDKVQITEADLGIMAPANNIGKGQERAGGVGRTT